ncbi:MAG: carboxylating nicotinate-nucleotide diphosphorylase [Methanobacteriota archaeon]|nr:MAG: carboxylating nicotinate-nucleotide diphosphorylase [Euryarchaeota archaeon]
MIDKLLEFLAEDLGRGDVTTESLFPQPVPAKARIISKAEGVLAGADEVRILLDHFKLAHRFRLEDGAHLKTGDLVVEIEGDIREMLKVERLLLNILGRMSGIATLTWRLAEVCRPYGVRVMGTRKTTPGFRVFEKRAIEIGGGLPHRMGLYDGVLIKDNHLAFRGVKEAVEEARLKNPGRKIEVEVSTAEDAAEAASAGAGIIMLDNLSPGDAREVIEALERQGLRRAVEIELSGGITAENIEEYAKTGADYISLGCLTTGSGWLDFSMKIVR